VLVHIVTDYEAGALAFAEVVQRIKLHLPDAEPVLVPVPPFYTVAAGFCIARLGLYPAPLGTLICHNEAPQEDDDPTDVHVVSHASRGSRRGRQSRDEIRHN